MKLLCVGLNWKTPVRIRERLALEGDRLARAHECLGGAWPDAEFVILSTCNRTEIYAARAEDAGGPELHDLCGFLAEFQGMNLTDFYDHLYFQEDAGAALHLFKVASGLDSLILGEGQILGQARAAYQAAVDHGTCRALLHGLFQRALAVAKRVQTETELGRGRLSVASAAVDFVHGVFEDFSDKTVLVIGAGKMAELFLTHLASLGVGRLLIANRSGERAVDLATRFGGHQRPWDELRAALIEADIVLSSTGADEPIMRAAEFPAIMKARRHRLLAIVDVAVPRDFEVAIGKLDNVLLWNIDDLEKVRIETLRAREGQLDRALRIVEEETEIFQAAMALRRTGPIIGRLEREYQRITEEELGRLLPQLNGMPDEHKEKIRLFAHRLKNKFLHPPKAALREEAKSGAPHGLVEALRRLFGITDD